jgi:hypothetical protein
MLQEIVVEKAEILQKLITEKVNQLDQNISAYQRPLEKQLERHGERIAGMQSPLPPLQENLKATKVLEEQNKQLVSILKDLQVQTGELAKTSPTPQDIKNEIKFALVKNQLYFTRKTTHGGQVDHDRCLQLYEKISQASEAKMEARVGGLEKQWATREEIWQKDFLFQNQKIDGLIKENGHLRAKVELLEKNPHSLEEHALNALLMPGVLNALGSTCPQGGRGGDSRRTMPAPQNPEFEERGGIHLRENPTPLEVQRKGKRSGR